MMTVSKTIALMAGIMLCDQATWAGDVQQVAFLPNAAATSGDGIKAVSQFNGFAVYEHQRRPATTKAAPPVQTIDGSAVATPATPGPCQQGMPSRDGLAAAARLRRQASINLVAAAECRHNIPAGLLDALVVAESSYRVDARSPVGAVGLAQLMPTTAHELDVSDRLDPLQNIEGGARYLRSMLDRFASVPLALAAYNAGPNAVDKAKGIPPYRETTRYVSRILELWSPANTASEPRPASFVQMLSF